MKREGYYTPFVALIGHPISYTTNSDKRCTLQSFTLPRYCNNQTQYVGVIYEINGTGCFHILTRLKL